MGRLSTEAYYEDTLDGLKDKKQHSKLAKIILIVNYVSSLVWSAKSRTYEPLLSKQKIFIGNV
jgi:hypothetical protein